MSLIRHLQAVPLAPVPAHCADLSLPMAAAAGEAFVPCLRCGAPNGSTAVDCWRCEAEMEDLGRGAQGLSSRATAKVADRAGEHREVSAGHGAAANDTAPPARQRELDVIAAIQRSIAAAADEPAAAVKHQEAFPALTQRVGGLDSTAPPATQSTGDRRVQYLVAAVAVLIGLPLVALVWFHGSWNRTDDAGSAEIGRARVAAPSRPAITRPEGCNPTAAALGLCPAAQAPLKQ